MKSTSRNKVQDEPALAEKVAKLKKKARNYLIKTEVMQFRLDQETYRALFSIAENRQRPVGTLVREWITERVKVEFQPSCTEHVSGLNQLRKIIRHEVELVLNRKRMSRRRA
jgi:hypothetical protein